MMAIEPAIQSFSGSLLSTAPVPSNRVQIQSTFFWGAVCLCQGRGLLAVEVSALSLEFWHFAC